MKIIVVEDEKKWNEIITKILEKELEKKKLDIKILSFCNYDKDLSTIIRSKETNFYILDVELSSKSGIDIARMIRQNNDWESMIIISSAHNQHESFITKCLYLLGYISKFDDFENKLINNFNLGLNILKSRGYIENDNEILKDDILYIQKENQSKYSIIYTFNDEIRVRKSLKQLKEEYNLSKIKPYLLVNAKNTILVSNDEIIFRNNTKIKL